MLAVSYKTNDEKTWGLQYAVYAVYPMVWSFSSVNMKIFSLLKSGQRCPSFLEDSSAEDTSEEATR
jgi:hypothetical protein